LRAADGIPVIIGMHIIIGMPPHIIIIGMPAAIMAIMRWQASLNMSIDMPSPGMTLQVIASPLMSQVIFIIGTGIGIMPAIMGIMPGIIGIMPGIIPLPIIGIMPPPIMGIIPFIIGIMPPIIGMAPPIIGDMLPPMAPIGICIAVIIGVALLGFLAVAPACGRSAVGRDLVGRLPRQGESAAQRHASAVVRFAPMK
jgi:hypothetical protein